MPTRRPAPIRLRPPLGARGMNTVVGLLLWLPALPVIGGQTPLPAWSGSVPVVAGAWLAWRGWHLRADCAGDAVTTPTTPRPCAGSGTTSAGTGGDAGPAG